MIALICDWGGDLSVGPSGDIAVSPVQSEIQQRIVRRLLTNSGDYIWHATYGASLGRYVGIPFSSSVVENTILNQLLYESLVVATPPPTVQINQSQGGVFSKTSVAVQYQTVGMTTASSVAFGLGA
jgi:hypothetical protein